jgi:hypothetical protein
MLSLTLGGMKKGKRDAAIGPSRCQTMRRFALASAAMLVATASASAGDEVEKLILLDRANPAWLAEAKATVPDYWLPGRLYHLDETALKARVAVFPKNANDQATPGIPFDPGQVLVIDLVRDGDGLAYAGSTIHSRSPNDVARNENEEQHGLLLDEYYGLAESEPGVTPCNIRGWALSDEAEGTLVRADSSEAAPVLGRLAPPNRFPLSEAAPGDGWRAEFEITGYRDGWFRIDHAEAPGAPYGDLPPAGYPETYSGTGWIRTSEVGAAFANTNMPVPRLLISPHIDALDFAPGPEASDLDGNLSIDGTLVELHACAVNWGLATSRDGVRGWWRGICSNQATNCS